MNTPLRVFIGYDSREPCAYHVLSHSILRQASGPVSIAPLALTQLQDVYTRRRGPLESTEFSLSRFLVPFLSGFVGHSVFMDCDMLCLTDIWKVWDEIYPVRSFAAMSRTSPEEAVLVCKHDYIPRETVKMDGMAQTQYPRKNWSSFIVFNNERCRVLMPDYVNTASGLDLHRFNWLREDRIGSLPLEWNTLVGEDNQPKTPKFLHYTNGGPWFPKYRDCEHADLWLREYRLMQQPEPQRKLG